MRPACRESVESRRLETGFTDGETSYPRLRTPPRKDLIFDNSLASFRVNDVAALIYECERLPALEEKIIRALGPPSKRMRINKKLNKLVEEAGAPDDD